MTADSPQFAGARQRYRLDSRIATGGMGEVWQATDTVLDRQVAVKLLKSELADDATFRSRFESEARHAAALHHPGVASVFDFGETPPADGSGSPRPFLVMELVDGRPLSELLRDKEPMPVEQATSLLTQAADAIAAAHAVGIVHRDIKPANLLVTPEGQVKVTDFGIARAADGVALTQTGQVVGTPQYLSPEQAEGRQATTASDVYALGIVLFECLAGHRPFSGDSIVATALAHLREPPPDLPAQVPAELDTVVNRCLAKDPSDRFPDAAALASALRGTTLQATAAMTVLGAAPLAGAVGAAGAAAASAATATHSAADGSREARPAGSGRSSARAWLPIAGAVTVALLLILGVTRLFGDDNGGRATTAAAADVTPDHTPRSERVRLVRSRYVGLTVREATARLEKLGLTVKTERRANPGAKPAAHVAAIDPAGRVAPDATILLTVWAQPPAEPAPEPVSEPEDEPGGGKDGDDKPDPGDTGKGPGDKPDKPGKPEKPGKPDKAKGKQR